MSFQYDGMEVTKLKSLWPNIASKLSPELTVKLKEHLESMSTFVQICCEIRPENFSEYTAFVMLSTIFELIESPSILFRLRKSQFTAHTFSTNTGRWCHDRDKVTAVAESIWTVSSNASNINHIIIAMHGFNQFTFNVSLVLLIAALSQITKPNSEHLSLLELGPILDRIETLEIIHKMDDKKNMFDFLMLFQSFQRLASRPAARDGSLQEMLHIESTQLESLEAHLKAVTEELNKTIREQMDLNENTSIVHFIQLVLGHMDGVNSFVDIEN